MKQKKTMWIIVLVIAVGLSELKAQTALNVNELSGTQTTFILGTIKKLTFTLGNIAVNKKDGNISNFATQNVRYLNFTDITAVDEIKTEVNYMSLYPNPVVDKLQIQYISANAGSVYLYIMNIQGKIVFQQKNICQCGINKILIPFSTYQSGMYLCQIHTSNTIETKKFIKY
jgi:hypothetical protein